MKKYLSIFIMGMMLNISLFGQNIGIAVAMQTPTEIPLGGTSQILLQVFNNGSPDVNMPAYKIKPMVSVPSTRVEITGVSNLPTGWQICYNSEHTIVLTNGTDSTLPPGEGYQIYINVKAIGLGNYQNITSTLFFGGGDSNFPCDDGPQTSGNLTSDDESLSSVAVVAAPLPVKLTNFTAKPANCGAVLNWSSATEDNFSHYVVERKTINGFEEIGTILAKGSGSLYTYTDNSAVNGTNIYRLKMVDIDARYEYSAEAIATVQCATALKLMPTLTSGITYLYGTQGGELLRVANAAGQVISITNAGAAKAEINLTGKAAGMYYVQVFRTNQLIETFKIVKE